LKYVDPGYAIRSVPAGAPDSVRDDDRAAVLGHPLGQRGEQTVLAGQRERHLGDEGEVGVVVRECGVARDETRVPAHQLHQPDAADRRAWTRRRR